AVERAAVDPLRMLTAWTARCVGLARASIEQRDARRDVGVAVGSAAAQQIAIGQKRRKPRGRAEETEVEAAKQHVREPRMHAEAGHAASVRRDATRGIERAEPLEQVARARKRRQGRRGEPAEDRKSTRLNSSHVKISYAVFCLKK